MSRWKERSQYGKNKMKDMTVSKTGKEEKALKKPLCKLVKNGFIEDNLAQYMRLVDSAYFICKKCGRVSNTKINLCKPIALDKTENL